MVNQGTILGRIGKIDTKTSNSGVKITNMSIVTSKKFTKNGQREEKVTWHNVTAFNKLAEIAEQYVAVGDLLYIQGEMDSQKWTDANGIERTKCFIIAHDLRLMPKSKEHKAEPKDPAYETAANGVPEDDVPW